MTNFKYKHFFMWRFNSSRNFTAILLIAVILAGCGAPPKPERKEQPAPPEAAKKKPKYDVTFRVASLDLSQPRSFKIEQKHIDQLAAIVRNDSIDFLALQGVARYPGLATRTDVIDALSAATGMPGIFGEDMTISGRQTGNAIFHRYPALSHDNSHYDKISSPGLESALQAVIDCGARNVVLVSTLLPPKASSADLMTCMTLLDGFRSYYANNPVIVCGNLPRDETKAKFAGYADADAAHVAGAASIWYSGGDETIRLLRTKTISSPLGAISVADFGLAGK